MGILSGIASVGSTLSGMLNHKAKFKVEGQLTPIYVQFNPEEYSISESVEYNQVSAQGTNADVTQYVGSIKSVASLSFHFDTDSVLATNAVGSKIATDVSALTVKFSNLMRVDGNLHRPPIVTFTWGSISLEGVVAEVNTAFTMFDKKGVPVRAKVDCRLLSVGSQSAVRRSPFASPDRTKSRVLSEDTNLWELAEKEYGDMDQWRLIARANGILNPVDIPPGTVLKIPALTDL